MGVRSICCGVSGIILVVISFLFYVVAIGVGWGTFKQDIGGHIAGPVVISIPVLVVFCSFGVMSIFFCSEDKGADGAVICSALICVVGGLIVIIGGVFLIVTGASSAVIAVFDAYIAAGVFAIVSGILYYCGMCGIIFGLESEKHFGSKDESNSSNIPRE